MKEVLETLRTQLEKFEVGAARSSGGLTIFPLFGGLVGPSYLVAEQAFAEGTLLIEEIGSGEVPNISATNEAAAPVLLIDGEHLEGAKQSRIINISVLLPPRTKTVLPVSCVEQGRWSFDPETHGTFRHSSDHAYGRLRRVQAEAVALAATAGMERRASQDLVWSEIDSKMDEEDVASPTAGMFDLYGSRGPEMERFRSTFAAPEPEQTGALVCIGGRPLALDAFDKPATLATMWNRLISGYAMDAGVVVEVEAEGHVAKGFLAQASAAGTAVHDGLGLGTDVGLRSAQVVGNALVWEQTVVHLALFAREDAGGSRIARPSTRRARYDRRD
ncbi:MAG: ARPP-1 family domain-containing protein [Actinomycetota bacterium]